MKGRYLLFAVCLGCLAFGGAGADDADTARAAAVRRTSGANTTSARTKNTDANTARPTASNTRATATTAKSATTPRTINARTGAVTDAARKAGDTAGTTTRTGVTTRGNQTTNVQSRPVATTARTATSTLTRGAVPARAATTSRSALPATSARTGAASRARAAASVTAARAATNNELRDAIMGRDYTTCRQVYYECMDEFCANKDAQLKRCACSTRIHEFDKVKKQLSNVEDKLLDFNQRLLTVNMDKEDAAALFTATEGELAFNQKDTSASKKILDEISKKLNAKGDDSFSQGLSAISLSLDVDSAFDSVDSLMGASTTTKEGADLYNAALPICREMAAEVCDDQALAIAESGYQMQIEQDCNTIAKTYETQTDKAREKIREGGALLDISRLDIYQKRNSDDILTCKKKMLAQLSDTSVCGENLGKCLDISGQYIDPSTGQAFLTTNLANLASLITRPGENQTWTGAPGNDRFVSYLNSKKKYLEPAMENCQDIADMVWDEFIDDALAQIKLAQDKKLEEVRQSCTTLTAQCLSDTAQSIADFDARALSTFGVLADKTANEMCASVKNACTALLETVGGDTDWAGGMTQIATDKTYDTIMQTCREVGRACIIQACKSISGNFGMCSDIQYSGNRKSIINHTACWSEVKQCISEAGTESINRIFEQLNNPNNFYKELYGYEPATDTELNCTGANSDRQCVYDICEPECKNAATYECHVCRLAEKIWGNCEAAPATQLNETDSHNRILIPVDASKSTLLSWFAKNTGTEDASDSCRDTSCPAGYILAAGDCKLAEHFDSSGNYCPTDKNKHHGMYSPIDDDNKKLCCALDPSPDTEPKTWGNNSRTNCCIGEWKENNTNNKNVPVYGKPIEDLQTCVPSGNAYEIVGGINGFSLVCVSSKDEPISGLNKSETYPSGQTIECNGTFVLVDAAGHHIDPHNLTGSDFMTSFDANGTKCNYIKGGWKHEDNTNCDGIENGMITVPLYTEQTGN